MMNLKLSTFYVRGLNDSHKVDQLKSYLKSISPYVDIVLIQEYKLHGEKTADLGRILDRCAVYLFNETEPGYRTLDGAGCGGTAFLIRQ